MVRENISWKKIVLGSMRLIFNENCFFKGSDYVKIFLLCNILGCSYVVCDYFCIIGSRWSRWEWGII